MDRRYLLPVILSTIIVGSSMVASLGLRSQDTTLMAYLSGVMVNAFGGPGDNQLIRVNIHNHSLTLFEDGAVFMASSIAATGNPFDYTATPTGEFRILSKELSHTSRLSGVIMPLSMRFFEGYYFHDIPLTPAGAVINTKYSHGCIRLPSTIVHTVYDWTRVGAHVVVYDATLVRDDTSPTVYFLPATGTRQPIASMDAFNRRGFKWENVTVIPSAELASLPLGTTLY